MNILAFCMCMVASLAINPVSAQDESPEVTVRFSDGKVDHSSSIYCANVDFQSNVTNQQIFGMNVRLPLSTPASTATIPTQASVHHNLILK